MISLGISRWYFSSAILFGHLLVGVLHEEALSLANGGFMFIQKLELLVPTGVCHPSAGTRFIFYF